MRRLAFLLLTGAALAAPLPPLTATTTRAELPTLLHLQPEEIADGEGSTEVWPMDSLKRIQLRWKGDRLRSLTLHGDKSQWTTREGVTLGTRLSTLVRLNGGPLKVHSFGDARPGEVQVKGMTVTLTWRVPEYGKLTGAQKEALEKPGMLRSDQEPLRSLNPAVESLEVPL